MYAFFSLCRPETLNKSQSKTVFWGKKRFLFPRILSTAIEKHPTIPKDSTSEGILFNTLSTSVGLVVLLYE